MKKTRSMRKKDTGIAAHITVGVVLSLISTFIFSILLTILVEREVVSIKNAPMFVMGIHALSTIIGSMLAVFLEKGRIALVAGIVTAGYFLILLSINMLIFSSGFEGMGQCVLASLAGGLISVLINMRGSRKRKYNIKVHSR